MEQNTQKIYYEDTHITDFTAKIISLTAEETTGNLLVILDRTAFFPEEGGQKADKGTLNGVPLMDVRIQRDLITHVVAAADSQTFLGTLSSGDAVTGHVDWAQRFDFMQQHTGEHIISGLVHAKYGYNNVGFHLGYEEVTLDFDGMLTLEQLREIETAANRIIYDNLPVKISFPAKEVLQTLQYRSKIEIEGAVRIVEIPGVDTCACCAPHVETTGQIGIIKVTGLQSHRGGIRINILCGMRALNDFTAKQNGVTDISVLLSAKPEAIGEAVRRLKAESQTRQDRINALQAKLLSLRLAALPDAGAVNETGENVFLYEEKTDAKALRDAVNTMSAKYNSYCGIFSGNDEEGYFYIIGSTVKDCRQIASLLRDKLGAKGGGSAQMVQGTVTASREQIGQALDGLA